MLPKLIIFDTETASLEKGVVEIAWLDLKDNETLDILSEHCFRVNPECPIEPGAQAIHGISDADVADCPTLETVLAPLKDVPVYTIGHNVSFDLRMVKPHLNVVESCCTLELSRQYIKGTTNHKLETLQKELNLPVQTSHSALGDVRTCRDLLLHIMQITGLDLETIFERANMPKMLLKMPWGKHKGVPIARVPKGYRAWLLGQEIDKNLRYTLEQVKNL